MRDDVAVRFFNTAGECFPDRHYMLPPEPRLPDARRLIDEGQYFVVHAPRQTGKTTTLTSLARTLTAEGRYAAVYTTCEGGRAVGDDYGAAQDSILSVLRRQAESDLPGELHPPPWPDAPASDLLQAALAAWARACPRPLVIFFDEIDALSGASLLSVLGQLRGGSGQRPAGFPHSVVLCGLRDVRDYKVSRGGASPRLGGASPFNIKVDSLRVGDFTASEVRELYAQHTAETGQPFTDEAVARAFDYTQGQPWLVNALAYDITRRMPVLPPTPITVEHVDRARERLILARQTHLDSLVDKLGEVRVRRVIEPLIAGELPDTDDTYNDAVAYLRDLGLIARDRPVRIANPIYHEVVARVLSEPAEDLVMADPRSFVLADGRLDFRKLLAEFADFWRQHGAFMERTDYYHEAAPQLVMMGFLHRIVNGGGTVDREYGLGRGRIDIAVRWPYPTPDGGREWQREAIELKVWRTGQPDPISQGLAQLDRYLAHLSLDRGTLVIFDRRDTAPPPPERTAFAEDRTPSGRAVTILRA
jgi:hypothetical protein